jgi:anti-sigma-K factor RskA
VDISCIISSGDLELYVLGLLPSEEAYKMEQLISLFPELRQEVDRISETLEAVAATSLSAPHPSVKERLFVAIADLNAEAGFSGPEQNVASIAENQTSDQPAPVVPIGQKRYKLFLAASVIGLLLCIGAVFYVAQKKNKELAVLQGQLEATSENLSAQQQQNIANSQLLNIILNEQFTAIQLGSVPGKPDATAQVYWNKQTSEVYIVDISLPQAPANKQYQLWAIVNGKPVSAGLLQERKRQAQKMLHFKEADAFAITLEKKGGSASPTLQEMYVMGKTS